jgi:hypothetical protein
MPSALSRPQAPWRKAQGVTVRYTGIPCHPIEWRPLPMSGLEMLGVALIIAMFALGV